MIIKYMSRKFHLIDFQIKTYIYIYIYIYIYFFLILFKFKYITYKKTEYLNFKFSLKNTENLKFYSKFAYRFLK